MPLQMLRVVSPNYLLIAGSATAAAQPLSTGQRILFGPVKATLRLAAFEICIDTVQIITVLRGIGVAHRVNFAKHFVFPGLLIKRAIQGYRWSFLSSHDSPNLHSSTAAAAIRTVGATRRFDKTAP
jgi:hypothetical protein